MICTRFSGHRFKIEQLSFHHGCFPEFRGRHPFCFRLDPAVIVIVDIISNSFGELRNADTNITRFSHRKSPTNQYIGWQEVVRRCHAAAAPHTAPVTARGVRSQRIGTVPVQPNAALSAKRKNPDFTDGILP